MQRRELFTTGLMITAGGALAGCTLFDGSGGDITQYKPLLRFAVGFGTLRFLDWQPQYAERLFNVAESVEKATAGKEIDLTQLKSILQAEMQKLGLPKDEMVILDSLIWAISYEVGIFLQTWEGSDPKMRLAVSELFQWIKESAALRIPNKKMLPR